MANRITWNQITKAEEFRGLWIALDHCRYDESTSEPIEGDLVDSDEDLAELCGRMQEAGQTSCAILYCGRASSPDARPSSPPRTPEPRAATR